MKKLTVLLLVLFLLPLGLASFSACDHDLDFDPSVNWVKVEFDEEGLYEVSVYNQSNTAQLLYTFELEASDCLEIDFCGETKTYEANSTTKLDTEFCDLTIKTKGTQSDLFTEVVSERKRLEERLSECLEKEITCTCPDQPDCLCEVDCYPEEGQTSGTTFDTSFFTDYWWIFVLILLLLLGSVVLFVLLRRREPARESYQGPLYPRPTQQASDRPVKQERPQRDFQVREGGSIRSRDRKPDFDFFKRGEEK